MFCIRQAEVNYVVDEVAVELTWIDPPVVDGVHSIVVLHVGQPDRELEDPCLVRARCLEGSVDVPEYPRRLLLNGGSRGELAAHEDQVSEHGHVGEPALDPVPLDLASAAGQEEGEGK